MVGKPFKVSGYSRPFGVVVSAVMIGVAVIVASVADSGVLGYAIAGGVGAGLGSLFMRPRSLVLDGDRARIVAGLRKRLVAEVPIEAVQLRETSGNVQSALRGHEAVVDRESVFMTNGPWRRLKTAMQAARAST